MLVIFTWVTELYLQIANPMHCTSYPGQISATNANFTRFPSLHFSCGVDRLQYVQNVSLDGFVLSHLSQMF